MLSLQQMNPLIYDALSLAALLRVSCCENFHRYQSTMLKVKGDGGAIGLTEDSAELTLWARNWWRRSLKPVYHHTVIYRQILSSIMIRLQAFNIVKHVASLVEAIEKLEIPWL